MHVWNLHLTSVLHTKSSTKWTGYMNIKTVRIGWKLNKFAFKSTNNKGIRSGHFASEEPDGDIEPKAMTRWLTIELRLGYVCLC